MKCSPCFPLLAATFLAPALTVAAQGKAASGPAGANPVLRMCTAADLSLATDGENGSFNGMSHSGTLLVLRNLSTTPCRVPQRPEISFVDKTGPLPVTLEIEGARFMHPGPVLVPVVVAPDAEVTSKLRWVSGEVYDQSVCATPTALAVKLGGETQQVAFSAHICGEKAKGITYTATPLRPDPTYTDGTANKRAR